jgi:hypothetical protein
MESSVRNLNPFGRFEKEPPEFSGYDRLGQRNSARPSPGRAPPRGWMAGRCARCLLGAVAQGILKQCVVHHLGELGGPATSASTTSQPLRVREASLLGFVFGRPAA